MPEGRTSVLASLFNASDPAERERAWETFVARHSRLILHSIRRYGGGHDVVMDRYAFVLEQLRANDFGRLRTWSGDGRSEFTTWLVVVVKRLCQDHHRARYGRSRATGSKTAAERRVRRALVDFVADELKPDLTPAGSLAEQTWHDPEQMLRTSQLYESLERAVSALEPDDRLLLTLRFRDGLSAQRIARAMALPTPFHVYRRLNQLFAVLRTALETRGVEDPVP